MVFGIRELLIAIVEGLDSGLTAAAIATLKVLVGALAHLEGEISKLDAEIARRAKEKEVARRLMTVPGIGPLIATAITVLAPQPETFRKARDFAAWLGLTPRQHSTRSKQRLGAMTKMRERSLHRLLIIEANCAIIKRHVYATAQPGTSLDGMLTRKPPILVRVALANKMARIVIESWRQQYNTKRPHSSLGYRPPGPEVIQWPASPSGAASPASPPVAPWPEMHHD